MEGPHLHFQRSTLLLGVGLRGIQMGEVMVVRGGAASVWVGAIIPYGENRVGSWACGRRQKSHPPRAECVLRFTKCPPPLP